jgi:hypothetical protein
VNQIRFWLPVVVSLVVTPICLFLAVISAGAGHGGYLAAKILFPVTMLSTFLFHSITAPFILLAVVQFPVYGVILGVAGTQRRLLTTALVLLAIHAVAVASIYAAAHYQVSDPTRRFIDAVRRGDTSTAKTMLDKGADPNTQWSTGHTVLMLACIGGKRDMAKLLLERGADVNYRNTRIEDNCPTALFAAASFGSDQIVELLLSNGADVTVRDSRGLTVVERVKRLRDEYVEDNKRRPEEYLVRNIEREEKIISFLESAAKRQEKR